MHADELFNVLQALPVIDVHSHISRDQPGAKSLEQVAFYHMVQYPLRAAGVSEEALWPGRKFHSNVGPWDEFFDAWDRIANTGFAWGLETIFRDLYGFDQPLTAETIPALRAMFEKNTDRDDWGRSILNKGGIRRILSSRLDVEPLPECADDLGIRFTIESSPTTGTREHYGWKKRLDYLAGKSGRDVSKLADLRQAIGDFYEAKDWSGKRALVSWYSSECDFRPADDADIQAALSAAVSGEPLAPAQTRMLEAAIIRAVCEAISPHTATFQMCFGVQFLTPGRPHPVARVAPQFASSLGWLFGEFPDIHFNLLNGYEPIEPELCAHCLAYGNVSLASFWWETFYPSVMAAAWRRRLDMVPASRLCGFFSDGWCLDWTYARLQMTRRVLAEVLAEKVQQGWWSERRAVQTAEQLLLQTPRELFLPDEDVR
jgi:glucuronate isomerase